MKTVDKNITISDAQFEEKSTIIEHMLKLGMSIEGEFESVKGPYRNEKEYDNLFILKYKPMKMYSESSIRLAIQSSNMMDQAKKYTIEYLEALLFKD